MSGTPGSGGHNRLSKKAKKLRGTMRNTREKKAAPAVPAVPAGKMPGPPKEMSALQKRVWAELMPQVELVGVHTGADVASYRLLVEAVAATRDLDSVSPSQRPRIMGYAATMLARFGLDPLSRERLTRGGPQGGEDRTTAAEKPDDADEVPLFGQPLKVVQ